MSATDPRDQLRRYLEQRRDAGEQELVLDQFTVDDVLRIVGAGRPQPPAQRGRDAAATIPPSPAKYWRSTRRGDAPA